MPRELKVDFESASNPLIDWTGEVLEHLAQVTLGRAMPSDLEELEVGEIVPNWIVDVRSGESFVAVLAEVRLFLISTLAAHHGFSSGRFILKTQWRFREPLALQKMQSRTLLSPLGCRRVPTLRFWRGAP